MGVNAVIKLKESTRLRDVVTVMSILLGGKPYKKLFKSNDDGWYTDVLEVEVKAKSTFTPECAELSWQNAKLSRNSSGNAGFVLYHFEPSGGGRLMLPPSSPLWIAIGRRLVQVFGGSITYNDCAAKPKVYRAKGKFVPGEGNDAFNQNQITMLAVEPLTLNEVSACKMWAAYPEDEVALVQEAGLA